MKIRGDETEYPWKSIVFSEKRTLLNKLSDEGLKKLFQIDDVTKAIDGMGYLRADPEFPDAYWVQRIPKNPRGPGDCPPMHAAMIPYFWNPDVRHPQYLPMQVNWTEKAHFVYLHMSAGVGPEETANRANAIFFAHVHYRKVVKPREIMAWWEYVQNDPRFYNGPFDYWWNGGSRTLELDVNPDFIMPYD